MRDISQGWCMGQMKWLWKILAHSYIVKHSTNVFFFFPTMYKSCVLVVMFLYINLAIDPQPWLPYIAYNILKSLYHESWLHFGLSVFGIFTGGLSLSTVYSGISHSDSYFLPLVPYIHWFRGIQLPHWEDLGLNFSFSLCDLGPILSLLWPLDLIWKMREVELNHL